MTGDAQSFDAYAARTSPVLWASTAAGFAAAALVWWPLDAFVLPDPERSLPAFHALRGVTAPVNVVGAVLMARVPAVQRRVVPLASATLIVESAWTGWCMAMAGPVGGPWFSFLYVLPLLTILLLTPIGVRALVTATVSFAAWAGYWAHPEADLSSVEARLTGSFLVFATLLSVAIGHGLFALVRENHAQRMALARSEAAWVTLNGELEARVASQTAALRALGAQQDAAREADRLHLARELHDELGQELLAVRLAVSLVRRRIDAGEQVAEAVGDVEALLDRTRASTRRILASLRPQAIDTVGWLPAVEQLARELSQRSGIACTVDADPMPGWVPSTWGDTLYRVAQEALSNAVRHAAATSVRVQVRADLDALVLDVADDGRGPGAVTGAAGLGLLGIRERVATLGGEVNWCDAEPGTRVIARFPRPGGVV